MQQSTGPGPKQTFHDHLREAVAPLAAVASGSDVSAPDDAVRATLPATTTAEVVALIQVARADSRYCEWAIRIAEEPPALDQARARLAELMAQWANDIETPYAEFDGDSGYFVADAKERGEECVVLLAVLSDHEEDGYERLRALSTPEEERASADRLLDAMSDRYGLRLTGPAFALHHYLKARRRGSGPEAERAAMTLRGALVALVRKREREDAEAWVDRAFDIILEDVEAPNGYLRAELNAPRLISYLKSAVHLSTDDRLLRTDTYVADSRGQASQDGDKELTESEHAGARGLDDFATSVANRIELDDLLAVASLSRREREVLALTSDGWKQHEIASHLGIAPSTVGVHAKNAKDKLRNARPAA